MPTGIASCLLQCYLRFKASQASPVEPILLGSNFGLIQTLFKGTAANNGMHAQHLHVHWSSIPIMLEGLSTASGALTAGLLERCTSTWPALLYMPGIVNGSGCIHWLACACTDTTRATLAGSAVHTCTAHLHLSIYLPVYPLGQWRLHHARDQIARPTVKLSQDVLMGAVVAKSGLPICMLRHDVCMTQTLHDTSWHGRQQTAFARLC